MTDLRPVNFQRALEPHVATTIDSGIAYTEAITPEFSIAAADFERAVIPILDGIDKEIDRKRDVIPKEAETVEVGTRVDWNLEGVQYQAKIASVTDPEDLASIDPDVLFPGDGFPAEVR